MAAVRGGDAQAVDALPAAGADPDTEDEDGTPALRLAVEAFDHPIVEVLLQASAGTERADSAGRTPLLRAIELGARDIVESLITHGARLWVTDARGATPWNRPGTGTAGISSPSSTARPASRGRSFAAPSRPIPRRGSARNCPWAGSPSGPGTRRY